MAKSATRRSPPANGRRPFVSIIETLKGRPMLCGFCEKECLICECGTCHSSVCQFMLAVMPFVQTRYDVEGKT